MELLLVISFLIHGITLYGLYQLFQNQKQINSETSQTDIEHVLAAFVSEMKEDNDQLIRTLYTSAPAGNEKPAGRDRSGKKQEGEGESDQTDIAEEEAFAPPVEPSLEKYEQSLAARAFFLEKEGKSVTEIAKKLDCGKGEIELMLKFRR